METEAQVRAELAAVDAQLQLLERPPKMIFDVETEEGRGGRPLQSNESLKRLLILYILLMLFLIKNTI